MKILKFGGTSVGTPESILRVKEIVSSRQEPSIVVVSALGGVTDQLIRASRLAAAGDTAFRDEIAQLRARHHSVCEAVVVPLFLWCSHLCYSDVCQRIAYHA